MLNMLSKIIRKGKFLYDLYIGKDEFAVNISAWFRDKGDETLRFSYPLNSESVVFDVGAHTGEFTAEILERFDSTVFLFEPSKEFYNHCRDRFGEFQNVKCFNFGLSDRNQKVILSREGTASSTIRNAEKGDEVVLRDVSEIISELGVSNIDLMKINVEGGEFEIIPRLIELEYIDFIEYLQIQFHDFFAAASEKRCAIRKDLENTHNEQWNYPFVWESWSRD